MLEGILGEEEMPMDSLDWNLRRMQSTFIPTPIDARAHPETVFIERAAMFPIERNNSEALGAKSRACRTGHALRL
jgi:hypothetical protein